MTNQFFGDIIIISFKTVEAEIKLVMLPQRVRGAEIRMKNRSANGPPRVQSNELVREYVYEKSDASYFDVISFNVLMRLFAMLRVFCNVMMCVKHRGYDCILQSARFYTVNQGGTADNVYSSLTDKFICQGLFIA